MGSTTAPTNPLISEGKPSAMSTPNYAQHPHRLPAFDTVREAYEMHYDGATTREIVAALMVGRNWSRDGKRIQSWLDNPHLWAPWLDEVALERAAWFDRGVIENLSLWEWRVFTATVDIPEDDRHDKWLKWVRLPETMRATILVARERRQSMDAVVAIGDAA